MSIKLLDTSTLILRTFDDEAQVPPYAILSHTWYSEEEEVTLAEIIAISKDKTHPATRKPGYDKIAKTCSKARSFSIAYAWVDTCCIDKSSSTELSEAINSMFRWYERADICFAYLADFKLVQVETNEEQHRDAAADVQPLITTAFSISTCKWFTRGWCLQELLAPAKVTFYDSRWRLVGRKDQMAFEIARITEIDEEALFMTPSELRQLPVGMRLSWAARRRTKRKEDMAYCLLGIFGISMPMLYGEGGQRAFARLQEEIIKETSDLSIFAFALPESARAVAKRGFDFGFLTAPEPWYFLDCKGLQYTNVDVQWNTSFDLTNKGLYFRRAELYVDGQHGVYILPLHCNLPFERPKRLYLRKIGPGLYCRLDEVSLPFEVSSYDAMDADGHGDSYTRVYEEVYIKNNAPHSIIGGVTRLEKLDAADLSAISIQSHTHNLFHALQVLQFSPTASRWDASRMLFLTRGERRFRGCLKLFPHLAVESIDSNNHGADIQTRTTGLEDDLSYSLAPQSPPAAGTYVYLLCGIDDNSEDLSAQTANVKAAKPPTAWVRLYYQSEWRALEEVAGIPENIFYSMGEIISSRTTHDTTTFGMVGNAMTISASIDWVPRRRHRVTQREEPSHFILSVDMTRLKEDH